MVTQDPRHLGVLGGVPAAGLAVQLGLLTLLCAAGVRVGAAGWLAGTAYAVVLCALLAGAVRRARIRVFGPANGVTLVRATLVGCVTAIAAQAVLGHERHVALIVVAAVALLLDGAWARSRVLDTETFAAAAAVAAVLIDTAFPWQPTRSADMIVLLGSTRNSA